MSDHNKESRRSFLRNSGTALLAGYAFPNRTGLAQTVARPNTENYQSVTINTHDYAPDGEIKERLDFPKDWAIDTVHMVGVKNTPLTSAQIITKLRTPIGSKQLRDIAAGKKTAAIAFDDLSRPTPIHLVAEHVVNELNQAGIDDDHILFVAAIGSHQDMGSQGARTKLGAAVYARCPWVTHNSSQNNIPVGRTSWNNMIEVNGYFMKADVKILIGSPRTHAGFGFGGGPKGVIPGITSLNTIYYNHCVVGGINKGNKRFEDDAREQNESSNIQAFTDMGVRLPYNRRSDALEAARLVPIDFCVNIVQNGTREILDLYCGDVNEAHLEAVKAANELQCYDHNPTGTFDVVIVNTYPTTQYPPGFGNPRAGGISILVMQAPNIGEFHRLHEFGAWDLKPWWDTRYNPAKVNFRRIVLSQYAGKMDFINNSGVEIYPSWDKILPILEQNNKPGARVLLYPYYGNTWTQVKPRAAAAPARPAGQ